MKTANIVTEDDAYYVILEEDGRVVARRPAASADEARSISSSWTRGVGEGGSLILE